MKGYVPVWWLHVGVDMEWVYDVFRYVLAEMSMPQHELAMELGVYQSTVSRWASGERRPSLADMERALGIVVEGTAEKQRKAELVAAVVAEAQTAVRAGEQYGLIGEPELRQEQKEAGKRLTQLLEECDFVSASGSATAKLKMGSERAHTHGVSEPPGSSGAIKQLS